MVYENTSIYYDFWTKLHSAFNLWNAPSMSIENILVKSWELIIQTQLQTCFGQNMPQSLSFTTFLLKLLFLLYYSSYILRRPQNFAKPPPLCKYCRGNFCLFSAKPSRKIETAKRNLLELSWPKYVETTA